MIPINLKNKKFGRLQVMEYDQTSKGTGHAYWLCNCICGKTVTVRASHLKDGNVFSCGCYAKEKSSIQLKKYASSKKHQGVGNPQWKGKAASVSSIHQWLNRHFVKYLCSIVGCKNKNLDWALIKGKSYEHKRENFIVLCRSHHLQYDYTQERKNKISKIMKKEWIKRKKMIQNKKDFNERIYLDNTRER